MSDPLQSVSVVLPTRQLDHEFEDHCRQSQGWLERAGSHCVVCRPSPDLPEAFLAGKKLIPVLACAGSIYEAWNLSLAKITTPYVYFSTVGDQIGESDLLGLLATARQWDADVVVSRPRHRGDTRSSRQAGLRLWPHEKAMRFLGLKKERLLSSTEKRLLALLFFEGSMLGSSASNLYRTSSLRSRPFPCNYGHEGDVAWFFIHSEDIRVVFDPRWRGSYRHHPVAPAIRPRRQKNARFLRLWRCSFPAEALTGSWEKLLQGQRNAYAAQLGLERSQKRTGPGAVLGGMRCRFLRKWHQWKTRQAGRRLLLSQPKS